MTTPTIGIVSVGQEAAFFAGRYFREILTVASQEIVNHKCNIRILPLPHEQAEQTRALLETLAIDGVLFTAPNEAVLQMLPAITQDLPVIMVSAPHLDIPYSYVNSDNYGALRQIVKHLYERGRRRTTL